ncbi:hypothetical protein ABW19_dt0208831 [Dactylella cylindrospora]|nr:hypothetical protein ABW19_dt0208831 [Dactylella cylindrospora]
MQHRPTTVPPLVTAKREPNIQHLPPQTAPTSPSAIQYTHHPIQPSQIPPPPPPPPPPSHPPPGTYQPLQPFTPAGPPPPQMIAPGPQAPPPQSYHHHSAPHPHMGGYAPPPAPLRRPSVGPGLEMPPTDEMSPLTTTFPYHMNAAMPPTRRKAVRAAQACDSCRNRKAKCDEGRPSCTFCKDNNTPCVYREVPPPKQDRTMIMIQEKVQNIEKIVQDTTILNLLKDIYEAVVSKSADEQRSGEESPASSPEDAEGEEAQPIVQQSEQARFQPTQKVPPPPPAPLSQVPTPTQAPANLSMAALGTEVPKDDDNFMTIPHKHNTAAHKLLRWKSVRELLDNKYSENYVMEEEIKRGSLRIRGVGEGNPVADVKKDRYDDFQNGEYYAPNDVASVMYGVKGTGGRIGRGPREVLRLDHETTKGLLDNFLKHIYILHPFLNRGPLTELVRQFSATHGSQTVEVLDERQPSVAAHSVSPENSFDSIASSAMLGRSQYSGIHQYASYNTQLPTPTKTGSKRKRESNIQPGPPPYAQGEPNSFYRQQTPPDLPLQRIPDTLESAIVLLVLALGSITSVRSPVPGPLKFYLPSRFPQPSAGQQIPPGYLPEEYLENIDVIPGLAYCEKAINILAQHQGRSDVEYVQAALLAGLYWGQLGRPMDSWKWISSACMACQIMINMRLPSGPSNLLLRDTMVRTFWSCVQLESDLLAELDVPRSGITRLENSDELQMTNEGKHDDNPEMWFYFMAQYHIRKILNQVHAELYKQSATPLTSSLRTATVLIQSLEAWRQALPPPLQWSDTDPPAGDINAARLRAKYYGAKYIINRPFVEYFIHKAPNPNPLNAASMTSPALSLSSLSQSSPPTSAHTPLAMDNRRGSLVTDEKETPASYTASCKTCLEAAVQSTSAFHGFDAKTNRPILTNIFGTAHAYVALNLIY